MGQSAELVASFGSADNIADSAAVVPFVEHKEYSVVVRTGCKAHWRALT